ncbi:MAG: Pseudouridine synthase [Candidatus Saccharibacteria bacterium]|nr:Pseudouridine synthase [Candidatus Saccharibacteria bacterium]
MANLDISRAQRLDQRVVEQDPTLTRSFASKLIDDGKVTVNGEVVTKSGYKMRDGDDVVVEHDAELFLQIPEIDLKVLYEDDDCVVIEKPLGLLTHSKGAFNPEATVATWLRGRLRSMEGERAGIVHRLDRATSGVMICAKTPEAHAWLQKQFSQRRVKKTYAAVINGTLDPEEAVIDMPIERNPKMPQTFRVGINGKAANTHYKVLESTDKHSLVELKPETGRTHQLRVHLAHFKHPIVGDTLYKGAKADRLYLHALELELTLPSRERKVFNSPLPGSFKEIL